MQHLIKHGSVKTKHKLNALLQSPCNTVRYTRKRNHDYMITCFTARPFLILYFNPAAISADSRHFVFQQNTHDTLVNRTSAREQHSQLHKLRPARQLNRTSPCAGILYPPRATPPPPAAGDEFRPKDVVHHFMNQINGKYRVRGNSSFQE
jgi:hypothetical protein